MRGEKSEVSCLYFLGSSRYLHCTSYLHYYREPNILHHKHPPPAPPPRLLSRRHPAGSPLHASPRQDNSHRILTSSSGPHSTSRQDRKVSHALHSTTSTQVTTTTGAKWRRTAPTHAAGGSRWWSNVAGDPARKKQIPRRWIEKNERSIRRRRLESQYLHRTG